MSRRPWYLEFTLPLTSSSSSSSRRSDTPPQSARNNSTAPSPALISPPRLHLRSFITPTPAPPPFPSPWIWRCHRCHSIYRLGVTRRCLEDGHFFCSVPSTSVVPPSSSSTTTLSSTNSSDTDLSNPESEQQRLDKERALRKKGKKKKAQVSCASQFDYTGWEVYNTWRREIRIFSQPVKRIELQSFKRGRFDSVQKIHQRSCEWDCDFPSECAQEREWERQLRTLTEEDRYGDGMSVGNRFVPNLIPPEVVKSPTSPEEVEREIERIEREFYGKCMEIYEPDFDPELEIDPEISSQLHERERETEINLNMPITLASNPGLGIKGLDIDGLGEGDAVAAAAVRERKNSLEDDPPGSPLKESFSFGAGEELREEEVMVLL